MAGIHLPHTQPPTGQPSATHQVEGNHPEESETVSLLPFGRAGSVSRLKVKNVKSAVLFRSAGAVLSTKGVNHYIPFNPNEDTHFLYKLFQCQYIFRLYQSLPPPEEVDGPVRTTTGKKLAMDVGFGLCSDKCYSKLVKAKSVARNSSLLVRHHI